MKRSGGRMPENLSAMPFLTDSCKKAFNDGAKSLDWQWFSHIDPSNSLHPFVNGGM
jgi:hypothetical protein